MTRTNLTGVYFRETLTNEKIDKTYYVTYKNLQNKKVWQKIGKYSEGIREAYCNQKRNEIITMLRNGEETPSIAAKKKREILSIETITNDYFSYRKESKTKANDISQYNNHILPYFKNLDFETIDKNDILQFTNKLKKTKLKFKEDLLADKSINNILNFLKALIKYAFKNDFIKNDF